jgi:DNA-binding LacI/PurR family transcriptional regulator
MSADRGSRTDADDAGRQPGDSRATILDVAAAAGVSRQTVTRAMNDMSGISAATKRRVLEAAEALSYRPSRFGRGLVAGGDRQLGLIVNDLRNPYSPELAAAVVRIAAARGWNVMLADVGLSGHATGMVEALGAQTDIVMGYFGERAGEWIAMLGRAPVVELDPRGEAIRGAVRLDPSRAVDELADHLLAQGVRHPVVLDSGRSERLSGRGALILRALESHGLSPGVMRGPSTSEAGAALAEECLRGGRPVDAFLAFNDVMALGVLSACRRAGREVPADVRVVGIDGLAVGTLVAPTLTTLAVDLDVVAHEAFELAVAMHAGELPAAGPEVQRTVAHRLLLRESA